MQLFKKMVKDEQIDVRKLHSLIIALQKRGKSKQLYARLNEKWIKNEELEPS